MTYSKRPKVPKVLFLRRYVKLIPNGSQVESTFAKKRLRYFVLLKDYKKSSKNQIYILATSKKISSFKLKVYRFSICLPQ